VGRFVVVERRGRLERLELPWAQELRLDRRGDELAIDVEVLNLRACGLSRWGGSKLRPDPPRVLSILHDALDSLDQCLWVEPYPEGALGALCLTDHSDFDTVEKLRPLVGLFRRLDLRLTKGVFPVREPLGLRKNEPGLDTPEYRGLVDELFEGGSEIAFHGIGPRPRAPGLAEFRRRLELASAYRPTTWIDHGVGEYLFSRRAELEGGMPLPQILSEFGIVNYWSYVDAWSNPVGDVASGTRRSDGQAIFDFARVARAATRGARGIKGWMYPFSHLANNLLGSNGALALRARPFHPSSWRSAIASRRSQRAASTAPPILYGLDARGFASTESALWVFDTILLNHPAVQLNPDAIDRLCRSSGLALVHCYLACTLPYIGEGCLIGEHLNPKFIADMEHVAERQRDGDLCVLPLRDLRRALSAFRRARLDRVESGWQLSTASEATSLTVGGSPKALESLRYEKGTKLVRGRRSCLQVPGEAGLVLAF
jgi:hypothetical protein